MPPRVAGCLLWRGHRRSLEDEAIASSWGRAGGTRRELGFTPEEIRGPSSFAASKTYGSAATPTPIRSHSLIHLQLLGGLAVDGSGRAPDATVRHRHPLALLALVAAAAPNPVARDKVMALLWPESDSARASNSLRQALFRLRRSLGADLFLRESPAGLHLDPRELSVDLWAFREALQRGAPEEAVRIYRGAFLDGFELPRADEFGRWMDAERDRLARQYLGALDALADRAAQEGRLADAVSWRRRQADADPFSSRVALSLLKALVAADDRPGALQYARVYENLLRLHLETGPDPAVREFVASLGRDRSEPATPRPPEEDRPSREPVEPRASTAAASGVADPAPEPSRPGGRGVAGRRMLAMAAAVLVVLGIGRSRVARGAAEDPAPGGAVAMDGTGAWRESGCARNVAEAARYSLVYALPIPVDANYEDGLPPYSVDRSERIGPFDRAAYCLQLDDDWVWVSMDAFTDVPARLGVPVSATGATFQRAVSDMTVFSNVPGVVSGTGITTGNIEFWHQCYDEINVRGFPGASSSLHDFDDSHPHPRYDYDSCYGSMQVHNHGARQTVFAYNQWDRDPEFDPGPDDLGIGNSPVGIHPDWTFEANAGRYGIRTLYVLARPAASARGQ